MNTDHHVTLDVSTEITLSWYCKMLKKRPEEAIKEMVERELCPYTAEGNRPKKGVYQPKQIHGYEKVPAKTCWILGKASMFGEPYYRIVSDGRIMEVPVEYIEIEEESE